MGRLQGHPLPGQPREAWQGHMVLPAELAGQQAGCGKPGEVGLGQGQWWEPFPCADIEAGMHLVHTNAQASEICSPAMQS